MRNQIKGFELYNNPSVQPSLRINEKQQTITLEKEIVFYKGDSMEYFDYSAYMNYFSYHVVLVGEYEPRNSETEPIQQEALDEIVKTSVKDARIDIVLVQKV